MRVFVPSHITVKDYTWIFRTLYSFEFYTIYIVFKFFGVISHSLQNSIYTVLSVFNESLFRANHLDIIRKITASRIKGVI